METIPVDLSLTSTDFTVRRVSHTESAPFITQVHYLKKFPGHGTRVYGLHHEPSGEILSVSTLSIPSNTTGVAARYGLAEWKGNMELSRLVVHPDAPPNMASFALGQFMLYWRDHEDFDWVYSYADTGQGHHGGIYQAINAVYIGMTRPPRPGYRVDGIEMHPRAVARIFGTERWQKPGPNGEPTLFEICESQGKTFEVVHGLIKSKHLYILPVCNRSVKRAITKRLEPHTRPYPKREISSPTS